MQVLVLGKISQAAVLAASAYRNSDTFKNQTGVVKSRLIYDKHHHDTKVLLLNPLHYMHWNTTEVAVLQL